MMTMVWLILSFIFQLELTAASVETQRFAAILVGMLLETSQFMYIWLLPLKIAKDITDKKLRSFSRQALDPTTHSFVGTVVGALVGTSYIVDVVIFSNLTFLFYEIQDNINFPQTWICVILSLMIVISIASLYKEVYREWMKIPCIKRRFPKGSRSYTVSHDADV